jgi:hypothetical protein
MDGDKEEINIHSADLRGNAMTKQNIPAKILDIIYSPNWNLASSI